MNKLKRLLLMNVVCAGGMMLTACMGNPEDIGGFDGRMPKPPAPCSSKDPNAANNPACFPVVPEPAVVPGFSISSGSHFASSSSLKIMGRTAGSFVTPGKVASAHYVIRIGTNNQTFESDGN